MISLTGITVCVDYAQYLARSIEVWNNSLTHMLVITTERDNATKSLCAEHNVEFYTTDAFYQSRAKFNKGKAIAEAFELFPRENLDWVLFFDADVIPPFHWRANYLPKVEPGNLYGARRVTEGNTPIYDEDIAGFFHLAHISDPNMAHSPIVPDNFYHAGNYDSIFQDRWPKERRIKLPLTLTHLGVPGKNWCGVGNDKDVAEIHRRRMIHDWRTETILGENNG